MVSSRDSAPPRRLPGLELDQGGLGRLPLGVGVRDAEAGRSRRLGGGDRTIDAIGRRGDGGGVLLGEPLPALRLVSLGAASLLVGPLAFVALDQPPAELRDRVGGLGRLPVATTSRHDRRDPQPTSADWRARCAAVWVRLAQRGSAQNLRERFFVAS